MSTHKRYNAFQPLATPTDVLAWMALPFTVLAKWSDRLAEIEQDLASMRKERANMDAVGRLSFNR